MTRPHDLSGEALLEIAMRHKTTVEDMLREWDRPFSWARQNTPFETMEEAAAAAYESRKSLESYSEDWAKRFIARRERVAKEHGLSVSQVVREQEEGDWPDFETAAKVLSNRKARKYKQRQDDAAKHLELKDLEYEELKWWKKILYRLKLW